MKICPFLFGKFKSKLKQAANVEFGYFFKTDSFSLIITPSLNSISTTFSFSSFIFILLSPLSPFLAFSFLSAKNNFFNSSFFNFFCLENLFFNSAKFLI